MHVEEAPQRRIAYHDHKVLLLRNHGFLTCGASVADAYVLMFYLEKAACAQLAAAAAGELIEPPGQVCEKTARQFEGDTATPGSREWPALLRRLDRRDPSYKT